MFLKNSKVLLERKYQWNHYPWWNIRGKYEEPPNLTAVYFFISMNSTFLVVAIYMVFALYNSFKQALYKPMFALERRKKGISRITSM